MKHLISLCERKTEGWEERESAQAPGLLWEDGGRRFHSPSLLGAPLLPAPVAGVRGVSKNLAVRAGGHVPTAQHQGERSPCSDPRAPCRRSSAHRVRAREKETTKLAICHKMHKISAFHKCKGEANCTQATTKFISPCKGQQGRAKPA